MTEYGREEGGPLLVGLPMRLVSAEEAKLGRRYWNMPGSPGSSEPPLPLPLPLPPPPPPPPPPLGVCGAR